jgi:uncharacterized membrane protein YeaQ/YmgE (transglycosylase-associated protein family)
MLLVGLPPSTHDPEQVRGLADQILSEERYRQPPESIPDRVLGWIGEQIGKLLGQLVGGGGGTVVAWLILGAAIGAVVYLLARHGRVTLPGVTPAAPSQVMVELTRRPHEWRAEADALEAQGRWREGLRCRHRAVIAELVGRGAIPDQAGRTAGEYVRDVAVTLPDAAPALSAATELFEAAWYGGADTGAAEAARFAELDAQILAVRVG